MGKFSRAAGTIFLAAWSVYISPASGADSAGPADVTGGAGAPGVKLLTDSLLAPATQPIDVIPAAASNAKAPRLTVTDAGTLSIQINDGTNLVEVLRLIGSQAQVSIVPSKEVRGTLQAMDLYNVTLHEALDAIVKSNGLGYVQKGNIISVYSAKEMADIEKATRGSMKTEVFHLYYSPAANVLTMIKPALSADAQVSSTTPANTGIDPGTTDVGGNSHATDDMIVVTDYPDNLAKIRQIVHEADRRPQQILIEATILQASLSETNSLGIDFTIMGGVDFAELTGSGTGQASSTVGQALSNQLINSPTGGTVADRGYAGGATSFTQGVPPGGLQVGVVHNGIGAFLAALESVTDTVVLANPKVLALNKQRAEVIVGREDGYITTTVTQNAQTQTVQFLDTGTNLIFRPYIGDDGYVRMEIHPEDSSGGLTSANLPYKVTTEVTSNVMVKDGHTIVIGGLFREASSSARSQVPGLGDIPVAGSLFRNKTDQTTRQEIIILLTPHIVKDDDAYSALSEQELKEAEKLRVGVRKGMMWFGRERLADGFYEAALTELHKPVPDTNKALWDLNCATNLNPTFIEAIDLKEKLTGQIVGASDNSTIRNFVKRAILMDDVVPAPTTMPSDNASHPAIQPASLPQPAADATGPTTAPALAGSVPSTTPSLAVVAPNVTAANSPSAGAQPSAAGATSPVDTTQHDAPHTIVTVLSTDSGGSDQNAAPPASGPVVNQIVELPPTNDQPSAALPSTRPSGVAGEAQTDTRAIGASGN